MANRRMFARTVVGSSRFLRMPQSCRLLYYDLGMEADDDGFVEAFGVIRKTGATEEDLRILIDRGFITAINEDLLCYIPAWLENNQIRKDRYTASIYHELLEKLKSGIPFGNQVATNGIPTVDQTETQYRLGKDSVGKGSIESTAGKPSTRHRFVPPTVDEVRTYCEEKGYTLDADRFVDYYTSNGWMVGKNRMRDWRAAVRTWCRKEQPANGTTESKPLWTVGTTV